MGLTVIPSNRTYDCIVSVVVLVCGRVYTVNVEGVQPSVTDCGSWTLLDQLSAGLSRQLVQ